MQTYPLPFNEADRLRALDDLCILATRPEPHFDAVVALARRLFDVPVAFIAFQDQQKQWFKAHSGITVDAPTRDLAICNYTLLERSTFVVPDLSADGRFAAMPYVTGEPYLRFYAGVPLAPQDGLPLGTLCIMDARARTLSPADLEMLEQLAQIVVSFLLHHETELARQAAEASNERLRLETQLLQAQKMEVVGQLTGGIAHDFNNLLTVVSGNAEILTEGLCDPDSTKALATHILEAADRGGDLTQKLLAFSRRQTLRPERLSIEQAVQQMEPLLRRTIGEHIDLRIDVSDEHHWALADRSSLDSALLNLVVNARDAMPQGGTLTVTSGGRLASTGDGGLPLGQPVVFVRVADTGTGMPPEILARVFEPFFTTKEVGKGSGLGLSMVYGFAQQSGGHVSIESRPGDGTAVTILLRQTSAPVTAPNVEREHAAEGGQERVLLVEDDPTVLQFVSSQLTSLGYEVRAVANGPDALKVLRDEGSFDLLFTDVVLPQGMSGVELARHAREMGLSTKVLLTSGYSEDVFEQHGKLDESTLLLRKPYRRKDLADHLRKVLSAGTS